MKPDIADIISARRVPVVKRLMGDGSFLAMQDDRLESVFLVSSGLVKLFRNGEDGTELLIGIIGANELLGEIEYFLGTSLFCHMQCIGDTQLIEIPRPEFQSLVNTNLEFRTYLLWSLSDRLNRATVRTDDAVSSSIDEILIKMIRENERRDFRFTRRMYADYLGVSERTINRAVKRLVDGGEISRKRRILRIPD